MAPERCLHLPGSRCKDGFSMLDCAWMIRKAAKGVSSPPDPTPGPQIPPPAGAALERPRRGPLVCVVCSKPFERAANLRKKAQVCTPFAFEHKVRYEKQPDGQVKKIACACCRCLYKKTISKNRSLDGKMIPRARVSEFIDLVAKFYPEVHLAFRVGLNAMLRVTELATLDVQHLFDGAKPLPQLGVIALKKSVRMLYKIDIDQKTAQDLRRHVGEGASGPVFDIPVRTLQHKFKQVVKKMGLGHLSIHALRHTGISNRAQHCKSLEDLNYLRVQARHESIETTKLYLAYEEQQRIEMSRRVTYF